MAKVYCKDCRYPYKSVWSKTCRETDGKWLVLVNQSIKNANNDCKDFKRKRRWYLLWLK